MEISLQTFTENDFNQVIDWASSGKILMQFAGPAFDFPLTHEQLAAALADSKRHCYNVVYVPQNTIIGHAQLYLPGNHTAHLCRILIGDEAYRGRGFGLLVIQRLLSLAFTCSSISEASLNVYDWNEAAIRCYEKAGLSIFAANSRLQIFNDEMWTSLNMRLTRANWQNA